MRNYVIINGVNSLTIQGLAINNLPPITKPMIRTQREEIDGRDGDIVTELGYSAYDKQIEIGLWGNYDINDIIKYFTGEGTIVFSNEEDKYYNFKILDQIDYEKLLKFKTATITLHCQPFKYPLEEEPIEAEIITMTGTGETITLNNTKEAPMKINLKGNTSQEGTPTPTTPQDINVVSGDNSINVCGKNLLPSIEKTNTQMETGVDYYGVTYFISVLPNTQYTLSCGNDTRGYQLREFTSDKEVIKTTGVVFGNAYTTTSTTRYIKFRTNNVVSSFINTDFQFEKGSKTTYEPYQGNTYPIYLPVENYLPNNATTQTINGITYTINEDKSIKINGTASGRADIYLYGSNTDTGSYTYIPKGTYTIDTSNLLDGTMFLQLREKTAGVVYQTKQNNGLLTLLSQQDCYFYGIMLAVENGKTINNLTFYPQIEKGTKLNSYTPYGTTPIELCKIGNYQDYIYKDNGSWYLHKEIGKLVINGTENYTFEVTPNFNQNRGRFTIYNFDTDYNSAASPISSVCNLASMTPDANNYPLYDQTFILRYLAGQKSRIDLMSSTLSATTSATFKTWLASNNLIVYYVLATPTYTEITYQPLIDQLNLLEQAQSKDNQTNISQVNNDLPFELDVSVTFVVPMEINNIGNTYAKPILTIEGTGNIGVVLNDIQILEIDLTNNGKIAIDVTKLEAYNPDDDTLLNRLVTGDYMKLLINEGENTITFTGSVSSATLTNYIRWI